MGVNIRSATIEDKDFIVSLVPRLVEFGVPAWRDAEQMTEVDKRILTEKLDNLPPDTAIFIAEDETRVRLGFIHLKAGSDYYNHEPHGHISDVIVAAEGQGRGIGSLLIAKGEEWARAQGFRWLSLSVFASERARARSL